MSIKQNIAEMLEGLAKVFRERDSYADLQDILQRVLTDRLGAEGGVKMSAKRTAEFSSELFEALMAELQAEEFGTADFYRAQKTFKEVMRDQLEKRGGPPVAKATAKSKRDTGSGADVPDTGD